MSSAGWYPDPGGQQGWYRYWTGTSWTTALTQDPYRTPPPATPGGSVPPVPGQFQQPARRTSLGWWVAALAAVLALAVVVWFAFRAFGGGDGQDGGGGLVPGPGVTSPNICPAPADESATMLPTEPVEAGWISGGRLAFPALGEPWQTGYDNRVPFGSLAMVQEVVDQEDYDGLGNSWVSSVLVSDLHVGDGFASTKSAAEIVLKCILGVYYADNVVTQSDISSNAHSVDGRDGWLIETQLSFDIPGLNAKGERVLLLVVQTGSEQYGLFYASVPDTRSELLPDARTAMAGLRVRG